MSRRRLNDACRAFVVVKSFLDLGQPGADLSLRLVGITNTHTSHQRPVPRVNSISALLPRALNNAAARQPTSSRHRHHVRTASVFVSQRPNC